MPKYESYDELMSHVSDDVKRLNDGFAKDNVPVTVTITSSRYQGSPLYFVLGMPPSANHYYRCSGNRALLSIDGRRYKREVADTLNAMRELVPLAGFVEVTAVYHGLHTNADLDNRIKPLLDAIKNRVFTDDNQVAHIDVRRKLKKEREQYVEVWVRPYWEADYGGDATGTDGSVDAGVGSQAVDT